ncbi:MAG: hypothetical protein HFF40_02370 [Lawsonibacter sp.]|nr:hypothetical protein [Lawsonibacter sp.]
MDFLRGIVKLWLWLFERHALVLPNQIFGWPRVDNGSGLGILGDFGTVPESEIVGSQDIF